MNETAEMNQNGTRDLNGRLQGTRMYVVEEIYLGPTNKLVHVVVRQTSKHKKVYDVILDADDVSQIAFAATRIKPSKVD